MVPEEDPSKDESNSNKQESLPKVEIRKAQTEVKTKAVPVKPTPKEVEPANENQLFVAIKKSNAHDVERTVKELKDKLGLASKQWFIKQSEGAVSVYADNARAEIGNLNIRSQVDKEAQSIA